MSVYKEKSASIFSIQGTVIIFVIVLLGACSVERKVCPAYQSAFIFDTTALKKKFSYFLNDTPKIYEVSKDKFLIIEPMTYQEKLASFRTIEMLPIYPVIPDSLQFMGDAEMKAEMDVIDSTGTVAAADSVILHPGLIGPFNVEQENYMYYFRKLLVLPDVREGLEGKGSKQNKGRRKMIRKNKRKRKKENRNKESLEEVPEDGLGDVPKKRKRLKGRSKGDDQEVTPDGSTTENKQQEVIKEEEEVIEEEGGEEDADANDDGF